VSKPKPSAPRLEDLTHRNYGNEDGIDVVFLVGEDPWRLPAHKEILQNRNRVFRAMFSEHFVPPPQTDLEPHNIPVPDLEGRAFDNLLK